MSHNIEYNEARGTYSFVEANKNELAWHRLGQQFDQDGLTATEAISACNADYEVGKQPIVALTPAMQEMLANGEAIPAEMMQSMVIGNKVATMRLDNNRPLGVVGEGYGIVQNLDAFRFIDQMVNGSLPEFGTSHDGSGAINALATGVRVVCNNTLQWALRDNKGKLTLRHTSRVNGRLDLQQKENQEMAYKALNLMSVYKTSFEEQIAALKSVKVTDEQAKEVLKKVFLPAVQYDLWQKTQDINAEGISSKARNLYQAAEQSLYQGIGQAEGDKGNGLWVVNGITTLYQNHKNVADDETFFDSSLNGDISKKVAEAFNLIMALNTINAIK